MRITHLRERDAQTYRFRFYTDGGEYTGQPGVTLSVTDLKVIVSDTDSGGKKLKCSSTCTLPNNLTYIWYENGQPVIHCKSASCAVPAVSGAVSYSCTVEGHESFISPPVYSSVITVGVVVFLGVAVFLILITAALCMWRKKGHSSAEESEQCVSATVYGVVSALAMTSDPTSREISDDQDDNHLSSVYFRPFHSQEEPPFLTAKLALDSTEEEGIQYAAVNFSRRTAAPQSPLAEAADDPSQTYSQIQKHKPAT
ncbi:uncharacterized protein LOC118800921 [Colossoma macropomum]|uniref:uncharacterized protein LOC118800921 n=1 Tax=Colossoma macropomum TaxID=42526 RepID=UPI0018653D21|nr:uncharacterized protein LOC118800921 [Colossoma macropomum]